jgi:hypothetical protein
MKGEAMTSDDKVPQVMMTVADLLGLIDGLDPMDKETVFRNSFAALAQENELLRAVEHAAQAVAAAEASGTIEQVVGRISELRDELMRLAVWRAKEPA